MLWESLDFSPYVVETVSVFFFNLMVRVASGGDPIFQNSGVRYSGDPNMSRRFWRPWLLLVVELIPWILGGLGLIGIRGARMWEVHVNVWSSFAALSYSAAIGHATSIDQDLEDFGEMFCSMQPVYIIGELSQILMELSGIMPSIPFHFRVAPLVLLQAVAGSRALQSELPWAAASLWGASTLSSEFAFGLFHLGASSFQSMLSGLEEAQLVIQKQRDVYMLLLDNATDGCCSLENECAGGPRWIEVSLKLQGLLGIQTQSVALARILASASDMERLLTLEHVESLAGVGR